MRESTPEPLSKPSPGALPPSRWDLGQLEEIRRLATEQQEALRHGQVQRFEALLERREALIEALGVSAAAVPGENVIPFPAAAPPEKERLQALQVLQKIMSLDRENEKRLRARVEQVRESLGQVRRGGQAQQRYAPRTAPQGRIERTG